MSAYSIIIGINAGISLTTGHHNILIGDDVDVDYPNQSFLFRARFEDGELVSKELTPKEWLEIYEIFQFEGLRAMLVFMGYSLPPRYPDVKIK